MPELPDLTVFAENLDKTVTKKKIAEVVCQRNLRLNVTPEALSQALQSQTIDAVERWGKEIRFLTSNGHELYIHLMLSGGFVLTRKPDTEPFPQLVFSFEDGLHLVVSDVKGLVNVALNPDRAAAGPDAMALTNAELKRLAARYPRATAKGFLIDQKIMRGIGNAYADEILWEARISPKSVIGKLPAEVIHVLGEKIPLVLERAVVSIKERNPGIIAGEVRDFLAVHNHSRKLSPTGRPIVREKIGQKMTYFTDEQHLYL